VSEAVIILQARTGSTRLPNKVLAPIGARSLLGHCLARLRIGGAAPVMLATTTKPDDDVLVAVAAKYGVPVFRGPDENVLGRYVLAGLSVGARLVVRATADNPAIDIGGPARVLAALRASNADHVIEHGLPHGTAVEALTLDALIRADGVATDASDREHVTPLIRRDRRHFRALRIPAPEAVQRPDVRLTVDTDDDLWFMREIAARQENWSGEPELRSILRVVDALSVGLRCACWATAV
jgi:spore coat polysaccharide biosynthesis protein SpsF